MSPSFRFGDVVRWRDDGSGDFFDCRYMVIHLQPEDPIRVNVICLVPPRNSWWEVGDDAPCLINEMEVVRES